MRVTTTAGCPPKDRGVVGVTNSGADLDQRLLPTGDPSGGLICEYGARSGMPGNRLTRSVRLSAADAVRVAKRVGGLRLAHEDNEIENCPAGFELNDLVALSYPGRPDVDLWVSPSGCATVSNGHILVEGGPNLTRWLPTPR
jgi:hypothetical protein